MVVATNVVLAALFALLASTHVAAARETGRWTTALPIVVEEALLVGLFLARRPSRTTSRRPLDWVSAGFGTVLPLLLRPTAAGRFDWIGAPVQVLGVGLAMAGTAVLGRSIGLVAADRGLRTAGVYRVVRHPMYAAYLVAYAGYLVSYPSLRNGLLVAGTVVAFVVRAAVEEALLAREPGYRDYVARVRWRFVPWVY